MFPLLPSIFGVKKMKIKMVIFLGVLSLFTSCGGGGSNSVNKELQADAQEAYVSSSWADVLQEPISESNVDEISKSLTQINTLHDDTVTTFNKKLKYTELKNWKITPHEINETSQGLLGGSAISIGTENYEDEITSFPSYSSSEITQTFSNYQDVASLKINGTVKYTGNLTFLNESSANAKQTVTGGISILYNGKAHTFTFSATRSSSTVLSYSNLTAIDTFSDKYTFTDEKGKNISTTITGTETYSLN